MKGNFLAVDTSGGYLTVLARKDGRVHTLFERDCAAQHSVRLMPAVEEALAALALPPAECNFFCAVTGPGSFTGIRIGISAIKGFCSALAKPALGVTSFDTLAYNTTESALAAIPAGRGLFYLAAFGADKKILLPPEIADERRLSALAGKYTLVGYSPLPLPYEKADPAAGLLHAVCSRARAGTFGGLCPLYVRKSQAEEEREKRGNI